MRLVKDSKSAHTPGPVRLAYCLNLHAASTIEEVVHALETYTVPLRKRILGPGRDERFGVGMYFEAPAAAALEADADGLARLRALCESEGLDPFTFNAFPYGGFQEDGLKERVYQPDWRTSERLEYTVNVGRVAAGLAGNEAPRYLSISTHPARMVRSSPIDRLSEAARRTWRGPWGVRKARRHHGPSDRAVPGIRARCERTKRGGRR